MKFKTKEEFFLFITGKIQELETIKFPEANINEHGVILNPIRISLLDNKKEVITIKIAKHEGLYLEGMSMSYSQGGSSYAPSVSSYRKGFHTISEVMNECLKSVSGFKMRGHDEGLYTPELKDLISYSESYIQEGNTLQTLF